MAKYVTLHDTDDEIIYPQISTDSISNGSLTADKMASTVQTYEKYFEYVQESAYTGTVEIDVPIDLTSDQVVKIEMYSEPNSGAQAWNSASVLSSDKATTYNAEQRGVEISSSSTLNGIYRTYPQVIAWGVSGGYSGHCSITIKHSNPINWPIFEATGYGSNAGQWLQGRINTSPTNVAYVRIPLSNPNAGGWVRAYRLK